MIKKVYIWDDLSLINENINQKIVDEKLNILKEIANNSKCKLEILEKSIIKPFIEEIDKLSNVVTIGTRPQSFITNNKPRYSIMCNRKIQKNGFANGCDIVVNDEIYSLDNINIVEDICVTGTTMAQILYLLNKNFTKIDIYFLIGYEDIIKMLKNKYNNINIFCKNILSEKPISESTCIFLSDLLYEKLGDITYIEHVKNVDLFGDYTEKFCTEVDRMKEDISK